MATPTAVSAKSAYRQLLRATRVAFESSSPSRERLVCAIEVKSCSHTGIDDSRVLLAARQEARRNFDSNRRVGVDTGLQINHAIEVANILRHNLVQGARDEGDDAAKWGMLHSCLI